MFSETAVYGLRAFHIVRITSCGMRVDMGAGICYHPYCGKQRMRREGTVRLSVLLVIPQCSGPVVSDV